MSERTYNGQILEKKGKSGKRLQWVLLHRRVFVVSLTHQCRAHHNCYRCFGGTCCLCVLKIEAAGVFKMFVTTHKIVRCHNPINYNINNECTFLAHFPYLEKMKAKRRPLLGSSLANTFLRQRIHAQQSKNCCMLYFLCGPYRIKQYIVKGKWDIVLSRTSWYEVYNRYVYCELICLKYTLLVASNTGIIWELILRIMRNILWWARILCTDYIQGWHVDRSLIWHSWLEIRIFQICLLMVWPSPQSTVMHWWQIMEPNLHLYVM
jgi:hypothetical protein